MAIGIREIDAKYEVLEKMGEGGMGAVYKARHRLLDELRVIKTIRPHLSHDEDLQQRFLREARVAAKMRHPHLATIHDFAFTAEGVAYIVMDFIDGQNLRQFQREGGRLQVDEVIEIARQALGALEFLHRKSFVHRDISSDNMMISWPGGEPKVTLIDLGLAKSLEDSQHWQTKTGMVVGKVRYISPEQLNSGGEGVVIDARSDLYSFGVVLYELLTRELPITGGDDVSLIAGHLYRAPRPFTETDPGRTVSEPLRRVVMKALEKDPTERWQSATQLRDALERAARTHSTRPVDDVVAEPTRVLSTDDEVDGRTTLSAIRPTPGSPASVLADPLATESIDTEARTAPIPRDSSPAAPTTRPAPTVPESAAAPSPQPPPPPTSTPDASADGSRSSARPAWLVPSLALGLVGLALAAWLLVGRGMLSTDVRDPEVSGPGAGVATGEAGRPAGAADGAEDPAASLDRTLLGGYHAIVIGNNAYAKLPPLRTAIADARAVAQMLERRFGFTTTVLEDATRIEMLDAIDTAARSLTARDNLLVYYAGHGTVDGLAEYWQPIDADPTRTENWISTRHELSDLLDRSEARHVLVVADSCYAGADLAAPPPVPAGSAGLTPGLGLRDLALRPSRLVLASGGDAPVLDSGDARHSIFARAFLDALEDTDGLTPISRLYERLRPAVAEAAADFEFTQSPVLAPIPKSTRDEGGELVLAPLES
ncbi:MAG: protein kinase [Acidobacteriota bacterium]